MFLGIASEFSLQWLKKVAEVGLQLLVGIYLVYCINKNVKNVFDCG